MNGIDRNELRGILYDVGVTGRLLDEAEAKVFALVQPAAGITITPEEARMAATAIRHRANELRFRARINPVDVSVMGTDTDALRSLAARLEASA